jgi:hypothetical protein
LTPPPIRYPLPTFVLIVVLALLSWRGEVWTRPLRASLAERWTRLMEGPPPPSSSEPKIIAGPLVRRVLLLRDGVPASSRPGGSPVETIRRRQFADVYDVWPLAGPPTHYRIGNRRPIGWVAAADELPWDTRLVVLAPGGALRLSGAPGGDARPVAVGRVTLPVVAWDGPSVRVAVWAEDRPWSEVSRYGWVPAADLPAESWGVLLSQFEVRKLLDAPPPDDPSGPPMPTRLRAVLGRLTEDRPLTREESRAAWAALPKSALDLPSPPAASAGEELLRLYEQWSPDAAWGGFSFRFVPLTALP